jgi:type VI secretion system secreted protein Hcp
MFLETGGGMMRDTSDAELHEIGLRMKMHKGSPQVFVASVAGHACDAEIHITRAGDTSGTLNYLEVKLSDTFVTHYSVDCDGDTPMETISLNFAKIESKYTPNKSDGKPGSGKTAGYCMHSGEKV